MPAHQGKARVELPVSIAWHPFFQMYMATPCSHSLPHLPRTSLHPSYSPQFGLQPQQHPWGHADMLAASHTIHTSTASSSRFGCRASLRAAASRACSTARTQSNPNTMRTGIKPALAVHYTCCINARDCTVSTLILKEGHTRTADGDRRNEDTLLPCRHNSLQTDLNSSSPVPA